MDTKEREKYEKQILSLKIQLTNSQVENIKLKTILEVSLIYLNGNMKEQAITELQKIYRDETTT